MHEREKEKEKKKVENQSLSTMQHQPSLHIPHKATELVLECIAKQMPTSSAEHAHNATGPEDRTVTILTTVGSCQVQCSRFFSRNRRLH